MSSQNKTIVGLVFEEAFNKGNLGVTDKIVSADYVSHDPAAPLGGWQKGPDGLKQLVSEYRDALPDIHVNIEDQIAERDKVFTHFTVTGTHRGELMGVPPTGRKVTFGGMFIDRIADGKIVESLVNFDAIGLWQQVGVIPERGPHPLRDELRQLLHMEALMAWAKCKADCIQHYPNNVAAQTQCIINCGPKPKLGLSEGELKALADGIKEEIGVAPVKA